MDNYNLDGLLTLPENTDPNKTPCPKETPFYDGHRCVICYYPRYWSVKSQACTNCENGTFFDMNIHMCVEKAENKLSVL